MGSNGDIVGTRYKEFKEMIDYLETNKEISLKIVADDNLKKVLLLSAASYFEDEIKDIILSFVEKNSGTNLIIISFVKNKAVERQYHTYFDWSARNANRFFSLFGDGFKDQASEDVKDNSELEKSIRAFLEIGNLRNELVHGNFAVFPIEKTVEEIYGLYCSAHKFIDYLSSKLT
ncbi:MAG: HEPN domain-containing protein [Euryarchaeota archaeon]|nr:HEPN domain-containing protein [Euryarchaeota archaeon]